MTDESENTDQGDARIVGDEQQTDVVGFGSLHSPDADVPDPAPDEWWTADLEELPMEHLMALRVHTGEMTPSEAFDVYAVDSDRVAQLADEIPEDVEREIPD